MNGVHDMGGMHCFGPIVVKSDEAPFHKEWERKVFAITLAMGATGKWNIDTLRSIRESLPPLLYLGTMYTCEHYYLIWLEALEQLLIGTGLVSMDELRSGRAVHPASALNRLNGNDVENVFKRGWPSERAVAEGPKFQVGDRVRTKNLSTKTHTRLPRYCRGKTGTIAAIHGAHVLPDSNAELLGEQPEWLYSVRFTGIELWGLETTTSSLNLDCWETYLGVNVDD